MSILSNNETEGGTVDSLLNDTNSIINTLVNESGEVDPSSVSSGEFSRIVGTSREQVFKITKDGISLGSQTFNTAPFRVTMAGELIASDILIESSDSIIASGGGFGVYYTGVAGEALSKGNFVRLGWNTAINHDIFENAGNTNQQQIARGVGSSIIDVKYNAQSFLAFGSFSLNSVTLKFKNVWTSDGYLPKGRISIQGDSSNSPDGSSLGTTPYSCLTGGGGSGDEYDETFTFSSPVALTNGTLYWIVLELAYDTTCGANPASGLYVYIRYDGNGNNYTDGRRLYKLDDGGSWETGGTTTDLYFKLNATEAVGNVYKVDATNGNNMDRSLGIVTQAYSYGETIGTIINNGVYYDIASPFTAGSIYYLSDTAGVLATTAGSISKKVGFALTTSRLYLYGAKPYFDNITP